MISSDKHNTLHAKMASLGIFEKDIDESFVRSSGAGGQHVNKTSSCVQLLHRPTGLQVKCQQDRSQAQNRFFARRMLVEKIEARLLGKQSEEQQKREKVRRQKRRRSRRAKNRMLDNKSHHAGKKQSRQAPRSWED